jgi:hypothetical protein
MSGQTITPPNAPGMTLPYTYLYLNSPSHWGYMSPQNENSTESGFLPSVPLTRIVGGHGVHWGNIMSGPPTGTYPNNQSVYNSGLAGFGMNLEKTVGATYGVDGGAHCPTPSSNQSTDVDTSYWWPAAECFGTAGAYNANPANILYTFYTVPAWASVINGTYASSGVTIGWKVASSTCTTSGGSCTINLTTTGNPGIHKGTPIVLSITSGSTTDTYTVSPTATPTEVNSTTYQVAIDPGSLLANVSSTNSHVTFTNAQPPSDANNATEVCNMPDGNTAGGHCFFKEYVTWIMMHTCRTSFGDFSGVTVAYSKTDANALNTCVIHYFEGWNEFTGDNFWTGNYTELAQMINDAAYIIHQYCSNCYVLAGSVAAGGESGHYDTTVPESDGSGMYIQALGELLKDWKNLNVSTRPDGISIHPYPGYDNMILPSMPETSAPIQWDPSVAAYANGSTPISSTGLTANSCSTSHVTGCVNFCTYNASATYEGGSEPVYNPDPSVGCTAYVENPLAYGTSGDAWAGSPAPGCSATTPNFTNAGYDTYAKASTYNSDPSPKLHCIDSFINAFRASRQMLTDVGVKEGISGWSSFISPTAPIWNTESGWGSYVATNVLGANTNSAVSDPHDPSLLTFYEQSYIARMGILGAESGAAVNLLYQWDINGNGQCTASTGDCANLPPDVQSPFQSMTTSNSVWGQMGNNFITASGHPVTTGSFRPTRAAFTFNRVFHWLLGASFDGVAPSGTRTTSNNSTAFALNAVIYDGANIQRVKTAGTSGSGVPTFNNAVYGTTQDGSVVWENMGDKNCNDTSTFNSSGAVVPSVWACYISKSGGYQGTIVWYTPFDSVYSFETPSGETCLKDIDGNLASETSGSYHRIFNRPALFDNTSSASCSGTDGLPENDYNP